MTQRARGCTCDEVACASGRRSSRSRGLRLWRGHPRCGPRAPANATRRASPRARCSGPSLRTCPA
jgi:hypothetical protein